jgi:hypothetical protein
MVFILSVQFLLHRWRYGEAQKEKEINQIMAHRNVGFLEAWKIVKKMVTTLAVKPRILFRC